MTVLLQIILFLLLGPVTIGLIRKIHALLEGRRGAPLLQPFRHFHQLWDKETIEPVGASAIFRFAPYLLLGTSLTIAAVGPFIATSDGLGSSSDLFVVVGLLFLGNIATALAGLDLGTSFGGMGASRELTVSSLVEPTLLVAIFALSIPAHSSSLDIICRSALSNPGHLLAPADLLALGAFIVVVIAETKRLPIDNPTTHLELTMIHEAMLLEYSGPRLAAVEWASAIRLSLLLGLVANLFFPIGIVDRVSDLSALLLSMTVLIAKVLVLAALIALAETALAKIRLGRVPELLSGSFILAFLSIMLSFFVGGR
ncbi:MAG: respiratory chain complex I subunit 1 family protein [Ferrimicrobium sp.]|uniref:respiratory chain complex I subunit 1 family protein n=1 Tax=Ferrimicrobium sp. TaxID=2926050 RepID=UPI002614EE28|nr:NADH-quinone oxidoreductase subunit H [Ferrimicrobium sp.]